MKIHQGIIPGAVLLMITVALLSAGCTQPSQPTAVTTSPVTTTVKPSGVTPDVTGNETLKNDLASLAARFAGEIDAKALDAVVREGQNSTSFTTVLDQLKAFKAEDASIRYVYILEQVNGTTRFIIDANHGLPDGSEYQDEYRDAPAELKIPVTSPIGVGPYTDAWGTFISGYAPVKTSSNMTVILVGVDVKA
jgi:hypothetical protein